jgi:hypothetical protein
MRPAKALLAFLTTSLLGCATTRVPPPAELVLKVQSTITYTAELRVSLRGKDIRGHAPLVVGFTRPDRVRLEMPGPSGARFVMVANGKTLTAVFPGARAVFSGDSGADTLARITGVRLSAAGIMDMLVGKAPPEALNYRAEWDPSSVRRVRCSLSDGTALDVRVKGPEIGRAISEEAFLPPPHAGYRSVSAAEARDLWLSR